VCGLPAGVDAASVDDDAGEVDGIEDDEDAGEVDGVVEDEDAGTLTAAGAAAGGAAAGPPGVDDPPASAWPTPASGGCPARAGACGAGVSGLC
jgi:hypothetical protein